MPLPRPNKGENKSDFVGRCMDMPMMMTDFPDHDTRLAVCEKQSMMREGDDPGGIERRYVAASDLRVVSGEGLRQKFVGHAVVFNSLSEPLMFFREQIAPEAVDRTLNEGIDVRALIDHDPAKLMGRLTARTLKVSKDAHGLFVEIDPPDTTYSRDALESVRRGDLSGMSFAFRTLKDHWDETTDPPTRTVLDMRVHEVSLVTFPAYPQTDVDVAQRSLNRYREERIYTPSPKMLERMAKVAR